MAKRTKHAPLTLVPGWVEYLRTSDEDSQAPERSQAYQHRLINDHLIEPSGLPLLDTYPDTMSGKKVSRVNYQRLLSDARLGKFSHVAIAFVDRFGRNDVEGLRAYDELTALGIQVRIATYPSLEPEKPDGRMIVAMLFNVAQFESARTAQRTRQGMIETLLRGDWCWKAPDAYLNTEIRKSELEPSERGKHAKHRHAIASDPPRFQVWRDAWELLLTDQNTEADICEELHARGYRLPGGQPFVEVDKSGKRHFPGTKYLSNAFHNWFYAGWLVVDNSWLTVAPKEIRGNWQPVVSTEDFERGLAILARRNKQRAHKTRHFYLLQGLVYLEVADGSVRKLTCSTSNASREGGGVPYYCVPSSNLNFLCHQVDSQLARWMGRVQVDNRYLPVIRETYRADVDQFLSSPSAHERVRLEKTLQDLDDAELFFARQYQRQRFSEENWERMAREWRDQRLAIQSALQVLTCDQAAQVANLDDALKLISKAGILYEGLSPEGQRELLRLMVEKVVLSSEGQIIRVELRAPFGYLSQLMAGTTGTTDSNGNGQTPRNRKNVGKTTFAACSIFPKLSAPKHTGNEQLFGPELDDLFLFAELTAYPQRSALEPLLTID
ncbi:MAG: recombinase family protein [Aggregatilineales bacterium]